MAHRSLRPITLHTSLLFDPKQKEFLQNVSIQINRENGAIEKIFVRPDHEPLVFRSGDIDLRGKVVMPGFVDSHTHIFLHSYDERPLTEQMRDESLVERTVRATNHARAALLAGYTTYRDLGTEALGAADARLRDCINRGIIPGPRLFVATDAVASSGSYEVRVESTANGLLPPRASDVGDGIAGVRAAVRRRVGEGADVLKFYADYRRRVMRFPPAPASSRGMGSAATAAAGQTIRFPPADANRNPAVPLFQPEEMAAMVAEARLADMPVAAHAGEMRTAVWAARAGVTTVEHVFGDGHGMLEEFLCVMKEKGTIWVPTLATAENLVPQQYAQVKAWVKEAFDAGVRIAAGGDTGTFNHGLNAREVECLIEAGIPVVDALEACMVGGWEACGGDQTGYRFGWFEEGARADIVALESDPRTDRKALRKVDFVMKDGVVYKRDGVAANLFSAPEWPPDEEDELHDEWTELGEAQPRMAMSVPLPVYRKRDE